MLHLSCCRERIRRAHLWICLLVRRCHPRAPQILKGCSWSFALWLTMERWSTSDGAGCRTDFRTKELVPNLKTEIATRLKNYKMNHAHGRRFRDGRPQLERLFCEHELIECVCDLPGEEHGIDQDCLREMNTGRNKANELLVKERHGQSRFVEGTYNS